METKNNKSDLRKQILKIRNTLPPPKMFQDSQMICRYITSSSRFYRAKDILLYCNYGSEVRTDIIFEAAKAAGKNTYYPKVEGDNMIFYRIDSLKDLSGGYHGIREPFKMDVSFRHPKSSYGSAIIIVPGTVFGRDGFRIGYGKGFYDRFLAFYPDLWKIGICYSSQIVKNCPHDEFDVKMDEIICEKEILTFNGTGEARWI